MKCDYIIHGGHVIDPAAGVDGNEDIYVSGRRIVPLSEQLDLSGAQRIDAAGCLVLPGLVDFHTHLGYQLSDFGLNPDLYTLPNGVTSAVDAGSGGTANFEGMYNDVFARSMIDIRCFLNVAATGIITERYLENLSPERFDEDKIARLIDKYGDVILGFKVRAGKNTSGPLGLAPLAKAVELGTRYQRRVCLHATNLTCSYGDIFALMRAGDIVCHIFQGDNENTILGPDGHVAKSVYEARARGLILDCACGRVNYANRIMRAAFEEGFYPDIISTDIIGFSIYGPKIHSLLSVMSHYYGMGMPLESIIRAVTATPAGVMGLEGQIGTLQPGALADIFVTKLMPSAFDVTDKFGETVHVRESFVPLLTMKAGQLAYRDITFTPYPAAGR